MPNPNRPLPPKNPSSRRLLTQGLRRLLRKPDGAGGGAGGAEACDAPRKAAFVGIGSELRGDDAVGVVVANRLRDWQSSGRDAGDAPSHLLAGAGEKPAGAASGVFNDALFVNGGSAPENVLGEVKAFQPDVIVFIDAAVMGRERGAVRLIDTRQEKISGISFCTHSLPLTIIADYIRQSLDCEIYVIGIEPGDMGFRPDCALSPPVAAAADEVVDAIVDASLPPA